MKKLLLVCVLGICAALSGRANPIEVVLLTTGGHEKVLALEAGMEISLNENVDELAMLTITDANDSTIYEYRTANIASISYRGDIPWPVGIDEAQAKPTVKYTLTREGVKLEGLSAGARIMVYGPDGRLLHRMSASEGGCTIRKAGLPKGVVLVKVNNDVIKIMNP